MDDLGLGILGHHRPFKIVVSGQRAGRETRSRQQIKEIKKINGQLAERGSDFRLLTGCEVDILRDRLDFDDELLAELDVVVASLHVPASNEAENTKRLIRAAENQFRPHHRPSDRPAAAGARAVSGQHAGGD